MDKFKKVIDMQKIKDCSKHILGRINDKITQYYPETQSLR